MPRSPEQITRIFPNRKVDLSASLPQQIQQMLQDAGITVQVKDFSRNGPDQNRSFNLDSLLCALTSLNDKQLLAVLKLVHDFQGVISPDQEVVIGQYPTPTEVSIRGNNGTQRSTLLATHSLSIPQSSMGDGMFIGHTTFEISVDGSFGMSRLTTNV